MLQMLHLTEIKCLDKQGLYNYFYVNARCPLRNLKNALQSPFVPDGLRIIILDKELSPIQICGSLDPITYLYRKYFKRYFVNGYRINWEKELKKYLTN